MSDTLLEWPQYSAAPAGTVLKGLDAEDVGGAGTTFRSRSQIGGAALAEIARVKNAAPASADYGLVTRALLYDAAGNAITQVSRGGQLAIPVSQNAIQLPTYTWGARAIATGALTAGTAKAILSMEVAAAGTKTVRIRRVLASGYQTTALAGLLDIQLNRGAAASTAGTAITAGTRQNGDAAATTVVKSLPTITAATVLDTLPCFATPTTTANGFPSTVLYDWQEGGETKPWILLPGVIGSLVLMAISTAAQNWTITIHVTASEE